MSNFFDAIISLLEIFLRPETTIEAYLSQHAPYVLDTVYPWLLIIGGGGLLLIYIILVLGNFDAGSGMLVLFLSAISIAFYIFVVPKHFPSIKYLFPGIGLLILRVLVAIGAFMTGIWAGRFPWAFLGTFVIALILSLLINSSGFAFFVASIYALAAIIQAAVVIVMSTDGEPLGILLAPSLILFCIAAIIKEPQAANFWVEILQPLIQENYDNVLLDVVLKIVGYPVNWLSQLLLFYTYGTGLGVGFVVGLFSD